MSKRCVCYVSKYFMETEHSSTKNETFHYVSHNSSSSVGAASYAVLALDHTQVADRHADARCFTGRLHGGSSQFENKCFTETRSGFEEGSYLRLIDGCITQLEALGQYRRRRRVASTRAEGRVGCRPWDGERSYMKCVSISQISGNEVY